MITDEQFQEKTAKYQRTEEIKLNTEFLREAYYDFDDIYAYLEAKDWEEKNLVEATQFNSDSVFQNNAEAYFRMGFYESMFFQYSKMLYELWYEKTMSLQSRFGKRIHKGTQVHQIAVLYEMQKDYEKAWNYFLAGLVEDVLTGRQITGSQAYRSLRRFSLSKKILETIAQKTPRLTEASKLNPLEIVESFKKGFLIPSYEENEIIDLVMLDEAKSLWKNVLEEKNKDGK